jgi:magnesium-dependent phosphatase 1
MLLYSNNDNEISERLPKAIIFDLDGCLWTPEMYEILFFMGGMGSPFREDPNDALNLLTSGNNPVRLLGDVRSVFLDIYTEPHLRDVQIGISSRTDEPDWARELLTKFKVVSLGEDINFQGRDENEEFVYLENIFNGPIEIAKDSKVDPNVDHFRRISLECGIDYEDILFFDNEYGNCQSVASLGVSVVYCPDGVTREVWNMGLYDEFPRNDGSVINGDQRGW